MAKESKPTTSLTKESKPGGNYPSWNDLDFAWEDAGDLTWASELLGKEGKPTTSITKESKP